ncbi:MAG: hypothetical protein KJ914_11105 [Gammaproteobacteria bacterium]|nr:hypothetical protein [Gammaproteobacteria bacterium]MBU1722400.1 hypothetical protein [Gammaproteobacteria bacterium]MBU2004663.1 hypothetical protein [Gammaproteobacteria bacterium]
MKTKALLVTLLLGLLLGACGGGQTQLAEGGISGTGISSGSITGFGSIFVNGVEYDVDQASFTRNGVVAGGQNEYHVGEYVTVTGKANPDGVTGTATSVDFSNVLLGAVTMASADGVTLEVLGQRVSSNALTIYSGFALLTDLVQGNVVEVSGVRDASGMLLATNIRLLSGSYTPGETLELKGTVGTVNAGNQTFTIGSLTVDYSAAVLQGFASGIPEAGQYVEVQSQQALQGGILFASSVEMQSTAIELDEGTEVELEGVITRFVSASDFSVNGVPVMTDARTQFEDGSASDLSLNALVEVEGSVNAAGVLVAEEVSIKESSSSQIEELEGAVTAINSGARTFAFRDSDSAVTYTISVDTTTIWEDESAAAITQMNFTHLNVGDFLEVKTKTLSGGNLLALRIKREDREDEEDDED